MVDSTYDFYLLPVRKYLWCFLFLARSEMVGVELRSQNLDDIEVTEVVSRRSSIGSMTVASEQQVPSQLKSLELKMYSLRLTDGINNLLGTYLSLRKSTA